MNILPLIGAVAALALSCASALFWSAQLGRRIAALEAEEEQKPRRRFVVSYAQFVSKGVRDKFLDDLRAAIARDDDVIETPPGVTLTEVNQ